MKSKLFELFLQQGAIRVEPDMAMMRAGDAEPREMAGVQKLKAEQPVAYFLLRNHDYRAPENCDEETGEPKRPEYVAMAFNVSNRAAYDRVQVAGIKAYQADAKAAGIGDLTLTIMYLPASIGLATGAQALRDNMPDALLLEPDKPAAKLPLAADLDDTTRAALNRQRLFKSARPSVSGG